MFPDRDNWKPTTTQLDCNRFERAQGHTIVVSTSQFTDAPECSQQQSQQRNKNIRKVPPTLERVWPDILTVAESKMMDANTISIDPWVIEFLPRTYDETGAKGMEPRKRWLNLVVQSSHSRWHIKVTFCGSIQNGQNSIYIKRPKRRKDLQDLCGCIDFQQIRLLDDTVTEVILTRARDDSPGSRLPFKTQPNAESEYASVVRDIWVSSREDPLRIRYPSYSYSSDIPTRNLSTIGEKEELEGAVHKVRILGDPKTYIYKAVERPFYVPPDSDVLERLRPWSPATPIAQISTRKTAVPWYCAGSSSSTIRTATWRMRSNHRNFSRPGAGAAGLFRSPRLWLTCISGGWPIWT